VKNDLHPGAGIPHCFRVGQIAANEGRSLGGYFGVIASGKNGDLNSLCQQLLHDVAAQKAAAPGH
jgi:hypothetical protein